jgi:hypothetical protein
LIDEGAEKVRRKGVTKPDLLESENEKFWRVLASSVQFNMYFIAVL